MLPGDLVRSKIDTQTLTGQPSLYKGEVYKVQALWMNPATRLWWARVFTGEEFENGESIAVVSLPIKLADLESVTPKELIVANKLWTSFKWEATHGRRA